MEGKRTYTYTARNYYDPDKLVTFTLVDHHLRISFSEFAKKAARVAAADDKRGELTEQVKSQAELLGMKVMEQVTGPYHVSDTNVKVDDEHLMVKGWNRVLGMRLTPYAVDLGRVDNPDAAQAFADQLQERKQSAPNPGFFAGPLDYWFGWMAILAALVLLIRWPQHDQEREE